MATTFELWLPLASALLASSMSPGPNLALVLRTAINQNRLSAPVVAFAHGLGIIVDALAIASGLVKILQSIGSAMMLFQAGGAGFLLYLGYRMVSSGIKAKDRSGADATDGHQTEHSAREPLSRHVTDGFLIFF